MTTRAEFVNRFADVLSDYLGKSQDELRERGLSGRDFNDNTCHLRWQDGSEARFEYAFAVHDHINKRVGVFTEHCGNHDLDQLVLDLVSVSSKRTVFQAAPSRTTNSIELHT